jgi:ribonuclease D
MYDQLAAELKDSGRYQWALEDSAALLSNLATQQPLALAYQRIKGRGKLSRRELAVLHELASWREQRARLKDRPKSHICPDVAMLGLARKKPSHLSELSAIEDLSAGLVRHHGEELLRLVSKGLAVAEDKLPVHDESPLPRSTKDTMDKLRLNLKAVADRLEVPPELLARKRDLTALVESGLAGEYMLPASLAGWREQQIGLPLMACLRD